jgi:hypothetical protein
LIDDEAECRREHLRSSRCLADRFASATDEVAMRDAANMTNVELPSVS